MAEKVKDLVCGMEFDREEASATFEHKGKTYYFCNPGCKERFASDPEKFISREQKP